MNQYNNKINILNIDTIDNIGDESLPYADDIDVNNIKDYMNLSNEEFNILEFKEVLNTFSNNKHSGP